MELKEMCKEIRRVMKCTQKKLGELIGTNQTEISFIERGFVPENYLKIKKIIQLFESNVLSEAREI